MGSYKLAWNHHLPRFMIQLPYVEVGIKWLSRIPRGGKKIRPQRRIWQLS